MIKENDIIFKTLQYCRKNIHIPDLHSFTINIKDGIAFVEHRGYEVFVETITYDKDNKETRTQFAGSEIAVANRLDAFGADAETISM